MQKDKRKKRIALIILVTFILLILCLGSWWIFGNDEKSNDKAISSKGQAFNTKLPDANLKESGKNKLEIYMQAEKDSAKLKEQEKKDSFEKRWFNPGPPDEEVFADEYPPKNKKRKPVYRSKNSVEQNERKVNDRLEKLYAALNNNDTKSDNEFSVQSDQYTPKYDNNIAQLEKLLQQVQNSGTDTNPEMKQVETVLDKLLDIQHPERVKERLSKNNVTEPKNVFAVATHYTDSVITGVQNAFWGFQEESSITTNEGITIPAVVHQDQLLQEGSVIKLRLLQDIYINGNRIPKDNFLFGECSLGDQRLHIQFNSIAFNNTLYPVKLTAYDIDGNDGIYIPGAIGRDAAKNGLNDAVQQMQLATLNPSVGAQAATAGIQAAQNLLSKKVKRVQVTVKAGHKLLLRMKSNN